MPTSTPASPATATQGVTAPVILAGTYPVFFEVTASTAASFLTSSPGHSAILRK